MSSFSIDSIEQSRNNNYIELFFSKQHLHFVGIGGIGMSGIAEVLLNLGYTISGSDLKLSPTTDRLAQLGARVYDGATTRENVAGAKALVVSSAVEESNPEVQEARRLQIPVIPRGELLAELMRLKIRHRRRRETSHGKDNHHFDDRDHPESRGCRSHGGGWRQKSRRDGRHQCTGRQKRHFLVVEADEERRVVS